MTSTPDQREQPWVMVSELQTEADAAEDLETAFRQRLGEVDDWPGFLRLEVWADDSCAGRYVMATWWRSRSDFLDWMRSDAHERSHDRIPSEPRPRPVSFRRYRVVAT